MNRSSTFSIAAATLTLWCFAATLSSVVSAQTMYKYTDANGKVTYSDEPPKPGEKATLIKADKGANVITLPKPKGTAAQRESDRQSVASQRDKDQRELGNATRAAEKSFDEATKALEEGRAPQPNEQRIIVREGGNSIIRTAEYTDRIARLEEAVKNAEAALDRAREAQKRGSPD